MYILSQELGQCGTTDSRKGHSSTRQHKMLGVARHPSGHFRRIKVGWYFLDQRVELDLRTGEGETSLHLSTRVGYHLDKVWPILEKGALTDTETN